MRREAACDAYDIWLFRYAAPMSWPTFEALGVTLRAWRDDEVAALPETLRRWFPTNDHAGLSPVRVDQCMVNS